MNDAQDRSRMNEDEEDDSDERPDSTWWSYGSRLATGGRCTFLIFCALLTGIEACLLVGLPIVAAGSLLMSWYYWMILVMLTFDVMSGLMFAIALARSSLGTMTAAIAFYILACVWHVVAVIFFVLVLLTCEGDPMCAANLTCSGTILGAYAGPSGRFVTFFSVTAAMVLLHLAGIIVSFMARQELAAFGRHLIGRARPRRTSAAAAAAGGDAAVGAPLFGETSFSALRNRGASGGGYPAGR